MSVARVMDEGPTVFSSASTLGRLWNQITEMMAAMNQMQLAPLLRREVAEERRCVHLALMRAQPLDDLLEPADGGGLVGAWLRQGLLRRGHAGSHPPLLQDAAQDEPPE
jgi:hypothetical protein